MLLLCELCGCFNALGADAARRVIDNAHQAQIIAGDRDHAQISQHVLDLRSIKEACSADDAIRDAISFEGIFELVRLGIHAIEDRMLTPVCPAPVLRHDLGSDILRLVIFIVGHIELDRLASVAVGPEFLALSALVVADHGICCVEDLSCAAIVLLKPDHTAVFVFIFERKNVFNRCAAEFVNALVVVADNADIAVAAGDKRGEQVLQMVRVLILVNENILEAALPIKARLFIFTQQLDREEQEIVKVHCASGKHPSHILTVNLADLDAADIAACLCLLQIFPGGNAAILRTADLR